MLYKTLTVAAALALAGCAPSEQPAAKPVTDTAKPAAAPDAKPGASASTPAEATAVLTVEGMGSPFG